MLRRSSTYSQSGIAEVAADTTMPFSETSAIWHQLMRHGLDPNRRGPRQAGAQELR